MLALDKVVAGAKVRGLAGPAVVEVVRVEWIGSDALNVVYRSNDGPAEVLLYRDAEPRLELVQASRAFSFDGDGEAFRVASEAQRIRLAHLFDPYLAVHSSRIDPLPHQITAVYGEMLPRQPLRFLLADDPGAGKTIMAGLFIKELIIRGDLERSLIVAPGSLVEQWQDELKEKFDLTFDIVSREQIETSVTGNPFVERNHLIMRLDMGARSETLQAKLQAAPDWDLVICDEAHRMSANLYGNEVKYTKRYKLGQLVGSRARHFLLMTATPHNGNDADFQLFMGLLDPDRFEGRPREGARKVDVSDLMRRLTKEELRKFDGSPLFPERKAYTVEYQLSDLEALAARVPGRAQADCAQSCLARSRRAQRHGTRQRHDLRHRRNLIPPLNPGGGRGYRAQVGRRYQGVARRPDQGDGRSHGCVDRGGSQDDRGPATADARPC